ncbi:MAG: IMP cyclohydrolase [Firmicutes bacterium]|nr:IMP cyclohydrolase [Bacillota bacterium]
METVKSVKEEIGSISYVGRGIALGTTPDETNSVIAYFIMGRSENSRNRVFASDGGGTIYTKPYDESKVSDPSLIIYNAVRSVGDTTVVTNGNQTDTICREIMNGNTFESALLMRGYEPDAPNYTPRISGIVHIDGNYRYKLSILKRSFGGGCDRFTYAYSPTPGVAHLIHTYNGDGSPLPSFSGEPRMIAVPDEIDKFADELRDALNADNKISLYVRYTSISSGEYRDKIINKYR